ncbi:MAG: YqeG family HAD IIIA-type phosphatase [Selenomonadaceae bacterium]|nr:YqeG family HAD IIIA-type phosphatase [Selenomonadaceae bacterium]
MITEFYPWAHAKNVFSINYEKLFEKGYRGLIFDIDNTLVHHGDPANEKIEKFFRDIHKLGFKTILLSNNDEERIEDFNKNIKTKYICDADKPNPYNYYKAVDMLEVDIKESVVIGDQLFTDIWGANRSGMASIFVDFIKLPEEIWIGKRRYVEKIIMLLYNIAGYKYHKLDDVVM